MDATLDKYMEVHDALKDFDINPVNMIRAFEYQRSEYYFEWLQSKGYSLETRGFWADHYLRINRKIRLMKRLMDI